MSEWIEWNGGECPVSANAVVCVKYNDGGIEGPNEARCFDWEHVYVTANIIAYKVEEPAADPAPEPVRAPEKTLRDEFAMAALTGLLGTNGSDKLYPEQIIEAAFKYADAMLAAREVKP